MLDEPISLAQPETRWLEAAALERSRVAQVLGLPLGRVEHIGSTAVPGLLAKPIIDLQVGVGTFPPSATVADNLVACGYQAHGEAGVPERLYFTSRQAMPFNVHVVQFAGRHWANNILLRELLVNSAEARDFYASAKLAAIAGGANSLLAYSAAKAAAVAHLIAIAQAARSAG